tara:strand:- start:1244 stop:3916 length:2673 start_codon:yes stop_codon:yes gene_type:complete
MAGNYYTNERDNGFLGKVAGNLLDQFDNPSYNAKLYLIAASEDNSTSTPPDDNSREDTGKKTISHGGFLNGATHAKPENTVILAQTGVTGILIDNIEIVSVPSGQGISLSKTVSCTIKQPGAANFMDMIVLARRRLGIPGLAKDAPFFLEINFQGYQESDMAYSTGSADVDAGGGIKDISGPYRWRLELINAIIELDSTGSTYELDFAVTDDLVFADTHYKTKSTIKTLGSTITEHVKDFEKKLNEYEKQKADSDKTGSPDIYTFNLSNLVPGEDGGGQEIITNENLAENRIDTSTDKKPADAPDQDATIRQDNEKKTADKSLSKNEKAEQFEMTFEAGITIEKFIGELLAKNDDFFRHTTRTKGMTVENIEGEADPQQTNVNWFSINGNIKQLEWDNVGERYPREIIYQPAVYKTPVEGQLQDIKETKLDKQATENRIQAMEIKKAYEYIFTGRNDQILSIDLKYPLGINLLIPNKGGRFSTPLLSNITKFNSEPQSTSESLDGKALAGVAAFLSDAKKFLDIFKKAKEGSISDLATAAGLSPAQIKDVLADRAGETATALIESLSNKQIANAVASALTSKRSTSNQSGSATESDRQRLIDSSVGEEYSPEPSGYVYGADLLGGTHAFGESITEEQRDKAKKSIQENIDSTDTSNGPNISVKSEVNKEEARGPQSPSNTLFGYLYGQKTNADILLTLDMQLRGDPWYLGEVDTGFVDREENKAIKTNKSTTDALITSGGDNFVLFELRQPMYFDPFITDEDDNVGLYATGGQSYFITGIYRIIEVINNFNGGIFSSSIRTAKELSIDLSKIDNKNDISMEEIQRQYEEEGRSILDQKSDAIEERSALWDDPDYIQKVATGTGSVSAIDMLNNGTITSAQYNAWKAKYGG